MGTVEITAVADGKTRNVPYFSTCPHTDFLVKSIWVIFSALLFYFFPLNFPWVLVLPRLCETYSTLLWEIKRTQ